MREAARGLLTAHVDLLKAELGDIVSEIKFLGGLLAAAIGVAFFMALLLSIGGTLFLGEWLFGSMGWGLLHGLLLSIAVLVALALLALDAHGGVIARGLLAGVGLGLIVAAALGANLGRRAAQSATDGLRAGSMPSLDLAWGPAVVGVVTGAVVLGVLLALFFLVRGGGFGGLIGGLFLGAILGALIGWAVAGLTFSWQGAVAIGIAVGLVTWPAVAAWRALAAGIDPAARFGRLAPRQSMEAAQETKQWLEDEWAKRRGRLGAR